jgi:hypothetical protein
VGLGANSADFIFDATPPYTSAAAE